MPTPPQDARLRELMGEYPAVAATPINGHLSVVARRDDGTAALAEVLAPDGTPVDVAEAIRHLGTARRQALLLAEQATDHVVAHLALRIAAGDSVNVTAIARETGIARQTLYTRVGLEVAKP